MGEHQVLTGQKDDRVEHMPFFDVFQEKGESPRSDQNKYVMI